MAAKIKKERIKIKNLTNQQKFSSDSPSGAQFNRLNTNSSITITKLSQVENKALMSSSGFINGSPVTEFLDRAGPSTPKTPIISLVPQYELISDASFTLEDDESLQTVQIFNESIQTIDVPDATTILNPQPIVEIPLETESERTPLRRMTIADLQTPTNLPETPMPTTPQLYDKRPVPLPQRQKLSRGSLPKKSRKELREPINFASRKPTSNSAQTSRDTEVQPSTSAQAASENQIWILDYEYESYTKKLEKRLGYDYLVTDRFNVVQPEGEDLQQQTDEYINKKRRLHQNRQPTKADKIKARAEGYTLEDDWKTQFTIQAFGGIRFVKNKVKAVATQFRRPDGKIELQWERVSNVKAFAGTALREYLNSINERERKKFTL